MARRTLAARGEALLPGVEARLAPTTFDAWLSGRSARASSAA
ncbi:MAG TPA: hypothetical protein VHF87_05270 [Methylomirabilota bacterium]|jgi:hypothetical protein|nr:hypothetical protein [Methylomirabilota bacterium]